jgi:dolichol-phosphate mannosyltransferase
VCRTVRFLSLIIPLFNDVENAPLLHSEIERCLAGRDYEVIYIDDGSTDHTAESLPRSERVRVIQFRAHKGKTAAILAGMEMAAGELIVFLDGDLQNDPADISQLAGEIDRGADLACGCRIRRADPPSKRAASRLANLVRRGFLGDGMRDSGCGLKVMRRECIRALIPFDGMHRFIPALVKNAGYKVVECPVNHRPRRFGRSKYGIRDRLVAITDLFGVKWLLSRTAASHPRLPDREFPKRGGL